MTSNTAIKEQDGEKEKEKKKLCVCFFFFNMFSKCPGPSCEALPVSDECEHKDVPCSGHSVAEVQSMMPEMSVDMSEARLPGPSASSGLNTMDLDQLKRKKIKMQLKVLKLQEEYYTLKIKELKK